MVKQNEKSGQIEVIGPYGAVYLYTHDNVENLATIIYDVLIRKIRWDDPDYLTRMLFCRMVPLEEWYFETGYGIGTQMYNDVRMTASLDTTTQKIYFIEYSKKDNSIVRKTVCTFEEYVTTFFTEASL